MRPSFLKSVAIAGRRQPDTLSSAIVIDRPADELYALWRAPETLPVLMSHFATISILNRTDSLWRINTPLGSLLEWQARIVEEKPGEALHWRSLEGALIPNEGRLSFRPAADGTGTEVTLLIRFNPPGGLVGRKISRLFDVFSQDMLAQTLHRFKKMAEER